MKFKLLEMLIMLFKYSLKGVLLQCILLNAIWAADLNAQEIKSVTDVSLNLKVKDASLSELFQVIEKSTNFYFSFSSEDISNDFTYTKNKMDITVRDVLLEVSEKANLKFKQVNRNIIVLKNDGENTKPEVEIVIQGITITGKVTSSEDNAGLPGANVIVKGTSTGTVTDLNGNYSVDVPDENAFLVFSSVGYTTAEVAVGTQAIIDLVLNVDVTALEEIVVVGYGTARKATLTGSVSTVKGEELAEAPVTNVSNSLVGRLAGISSVTRSGEPGYDGSTIRIRGVNTLGNNDALIVIDGVPGRSLDRIDPSSIESLTVLKDASAAIYGSQAANGVILITTKRGKIGKPKVSFRWNQGWNNPTRIPDMADAPEYAILLNEIDSYRGRAPRYTSDEIELYRNGTDPWSYPNTDWFAETIKPRSAQSYGSLNISGGSEKVNYFIMAGIKLQDGYYYNSATKYNQFDLRSNIDGKITDWLTIGFDLAGRMEDRNFPTRSAGDLYRMVFRGKPNFPAYWPNGLPGPDIEYGDNPVVVGTPATGYDHDKRYVLNTNFRIDLRIIEGLHIKANAALDKEFQYQKIWQTPWYLYSWDGQTYGDDGDPLLVKGKRGYDDPRLDQRAEDNSNTLLNAIIEYQKSFNDHNVGIMAGIEQRSGKGDWFTAFRRYYISTAVDQLFAGGDQDRTNDGSAFHNKRLNYFGRINYNFSEKYLAEFVWRYDGSYNFPKDGRFGFFPGISLGWRLSEENWWQNSLSGINDFKLRASWGQTGNDRINEWQYLASYAFNSNNYTYIFGINEENKLLAEDEIPNKNVTWEVADQFDVGFETEFLDSKFFVEADYFFYKRSQILWKRNASVPTSAGFELPEENIGVVHNSGFDFDFGYRNNQGKFVWEISMNGGYARNEIIDWDESPGAPEYQRFTGGPMPTNPDDPNADLYYMSLGVFQNEEAVTNYPHWDGAREGDVIFEDVNDDGVIDGNDRVRHDKTNIPRFTGGLHFKAQFMNFDLSILFQGATGAVRYLSTESGEIGNFTKDFYDNRWTEDNTNSKYPRVWNRSEEYWQNNRNTMWVQSSDYLRLKNMEFGYTLPSTFLNKMGIETFRLYFSGYNLLTYSPDLKDYDPENVWNNGYPIQKVVSFGLNLTF